MKGSGFVFDKVFLLYYKCYERNSINEKDNIWFQYPVTVAFNHEEIKKDLPRVTTIKTYTNIARKKYIFHQKNLRKIV